MPSLLTCLLRLLPVTDDSVKKQSEHDCADDEAYDQYLVEQGPLSVNLRLRVSEGQQREEE
jgi:hypothetical protein